MKTTIYVFTGTGTSLAVAKRISNVLGDTTITAITKYREEKVVRTQSNRIGIVFPCYYGEMPRIVKEFVHKLTVEKNQYVFSVITAGGGAGYGLKHLDKLLKEKETSLDYGASVIISSNYMVGWYYNMIHHKEDQMKRILEASEIKINKLAKEIKENKKYVEKGNWLHYKLPHIISPSKIVEDTRPWDKEFHSCDRCNGCGICEKVCPVNNIKIVDQVPHFNHNCQRCMACIQYCPQQAIQVKGKAMNKPQYYHPDISIKEISEFHS